MRLRIVAPLTAYVRILFGTVPCVRKNASSLAEGQGILRLLPSTLTSKPTAVDTSEIISASHRIGSNPIWDSSLCEKICMFACRSVDVSWHSSVSSVIPQHTAYSCRYLLCCYHSLLLWLTWYLTIFALGAILTGTFKSWQCIGTGPTFATWIGFTGWKIDNGNFKK